MTRQDTGPLRRRRSLVLPLVVVALASAAVAGCSSSRSDKAASTVSGSVVYATLPSGQKSDLKVLTGDRTDLVSTDGAVTADPAWSPFGDFIAYITDKNELSVIKSDGGAGVLLTSATSDAVAQPTHPGWVPDGRVSYEAGGKLVLVQPDGTEKQQLTLTGPDGKPVQATGAYAWSPDGKSLLFDCGTDQKPAFCLRDLNTGKARTLFEPKVRFTALDWSPDGSKIVAGSGTGEQAAVVPDVYVVGADGTGLKALTRTGDESNPVWSPDSKQIAFIARGSTDDGIWVMAADGSGAKVVLGDKDAAHPDWVSK